MGPTILRPGQRILAPGARVFQPRMAASASASWLNNGTWSASDLPFSNTPTLAAELLTNTEFTSNTTGWSAINSATLTRRDYASSPNIAPTGGSDNFGMEIASSNNINSGARQQPTVVAGQFYQLSARVYSPSANVLANIGAVNCTGAIALTKQSTVEDAWETLVVTSRFTGTTGDFRVLAKSTTAGDMAHVDAVSAKAITTNTLYNVRTGAALPASVVATGTIISGTLAGVVYGLDSISSPTNVIVATHDGGTGIRLDKLVSGVWTSVISTSATYVAGILPEIRLVSANTFALYYNGTQRGTNQTISDAGTGLYHGVISTYSGNTITGVTVT